MALINDMVINSNGGVCLKKNLKYYTYDSIQTGCTCYDSINYFDVNVLTNDYVQPYRNVNHNFSMDVNDPELCLNLGDRIVMCDWVDYYVNSIVSTGYTGYNNSKTETRVIYEKLSDTYYYLDQFKNDDCSAYTENIWAIVNYGDESIWHSGSTEFFYDELDNCGNQTGNRYVKLKDINPSSPTFGETQIIQKCQNETAPNILSLNVTNITNSSATLNGQIIDNGGFNITESGFCYSLHRSPSINDIIVINSNNAINFSKTITGLSSNTYYYAKAYAKNVVGVSYGEVMIFHT